MISNERKFKIVGIQTSKRVDDNREYEFIANVKKSNILNLFEQNTEQSHEQLKVLKLS